MMFTQGMYAMQTINAAFIDSTYLVLDHTLYQIVV